MFVFPGDDAVDGTWNVYEGQDMDGAYQKRRMEQYLILRQTPIPSTANCERILCSLLLANWLILNNRGSVRLSQNDGMEPAAML